ncbi:MAG: PRC-barrel domain-containing protein [Rhizobiaceae bacterium]|nr:PRC-barrel domain-containing protein [Rhizobiaceae bacterium]
MVRKLLATTAIATLIATGALAQTAPQPAPSAPTTMQPTEAPMVKKAEGHLASSIIGETVYNGTGDEAENIGSVNDIVIAPDGQIKAIVVGVGGFLGIGQKNVALEFGLAQWVERDNDEFIVVETTEEALKALPDFDLAAYQFGPADAQVGQTEPANADELGKAQQNADAAAAAESAPADEVAAAPVPAAPAAEAPAEQTAAAPAEEKPADQMAAAPAQPAAPATQAPADETAAAPAQPATETAQAPAADEATDDVQTGAIDRSSLNEVEMGQVRTEDFVGTTVYGANDENVGEVGDIILSTDGKTVDAVILDVGGFLGIGEKEVALGLDNLTFMSDADGEMYVYTTLTKEQLEAQAAYDESGYQANRDTMRLVVPN